LSHLPLFTAHEEIAIGMGIHGKPGIWLAKLKTANAIVDEMMERLLTLLVSFRAAEAATTGKS
jgi:dihydroxyacetone kinase